MSKNDDLVKKIEEQAKTFKLRANRSPEDGKRHDQIQPDEAAAMRKAYNQLHWSVAKIGDLFDRSPTAVKNAISKPEKPRECPASPDNVSVGMIETWGVPAKNAAEVLAKWRYDHRHGKHDTCALYSDLKEDLITHKISFKDAMEQLEARVEAIELKSEKLLQDAELARQFQPSKSLKNLKVYNEERRELDEADVEYRQKHLKDIENLLEKLRNDVNGSLPAKEYGHIFKIETDPLFQCLLWHCSKIDVALGHLKINCGRLQRLNEDIMRFDNDQISINTKKKQRKTLQKEAAKSAKELQKKIEETLKTKSYLTEWCMACIPDRRKKTVIKEFYCTQLKPVIHNGSRSIHRICRHQSFDAQKID